MRLELLHGLNLERVEEDPCVVPGRERLYGRQIGCVARDRAAGQPTCALLRGGTLGPWRKHRDVEAIAASAEQSGGTIVSRIRVRAELYLTLVGDGDRDVRIGYLNDELLSACCSRARQQTERKQGGDAELH